MVFLKGERPGMWAGARRRAHSVTNAMGVTLLGISTDQRTETFGWGIHGEMAGLIPA